ncbi:MAG TPA: peptidase E [Streptosporangiaceae bacterium]|nr:peptidase E [Streptosporangiaceae bacterium]
MAADGRRHVLAIGGLRTPDGLGQTAAGVPLLMHYATQLSGSRLPKICVINTASGDDAAGYVRTYNLLSAMPSRVSHLQLFPMPNVLDPADFLLNQDIIFVGGGSVANMLAVWRIHGLDEVLRQAWQAGIILSGVSAGAICWFTGGTTDSFGVALRPFTDGLGILPGSYCPHYDSELRRRPLYQALVADGSLPPGVACDDGAAAHFIDDTLAEVVADRPGARGYLVERDSNGAAIETKVETRLLAD